MEPESSTPQVKQYVKKYGLPNDWSTLILMLDHRDSAIVLQNTGGAQETGGRHLPRRAGWVQSRVKIIAMTAEDESLQECAEQMLRIRAGRRLRGRLTEAAVQTFKIGLEIIS